MSIGIPASLRKFYREVTDLIRRIEALRFAGYYAGIHHTDRAGALRVAHLAYRFLRGEDVDTVNMDADLANTLREHQKKRHPKKKEN